MQRMDVRSSNRIIIQHGNEGGVTTSLLWFVTTVRMTHCVVTEDNDACDVRGGLYPHGQDGTVRVAILLIVGVSRSC